MTMRALRVLVLLSLLTAAAAAGGVAGCESDAAPTCESGSEDAGTSAEDAGQGTGDGGALYDPVWKQAAPMHAKRGKHAAVKLPDGQVLVVGPPADSGPIAEIYDPKKDAWTDVAPPHNPVTCPPVIVALSDGRALAVFNGFAEVFAPSTKTWSDVTPT